MCSHIVSAEVLGYKFTVCCWRCSCVPIAGTFTHEVGLLRNPYSKNGDLCDRGASHVGFGHGGYVYVGPWSYLGP